MEERHNIEEIFSSMLKKVQEVANEGSKRLRIKGDFRTKDLSSKA